MNIGRKRGRVVLKNKERVNVQASKCTPVSKTRVYNLSLKYVIVLKIYDVREAGIAPDKENILNQHIVFFINSTLMKVVEKSFLLLS